MALARTDGTSPAMTVVLRRVTNESVLFEIKIRWIRNVCVKKPAQRRRGQRRRWRRSDDYDDDASPTYSSLSFQVLNALSGTSSVYSLTVLTTQ